MVKGTGREDRVHSVFWYMKHLTCNLRALRDTTPRLCVVVKLNISHHNTGDRDRCLPVRYMFKCTHTSHVCNMCVYTHKDTGTCLGGDAVYMHRVQVQVYGTCMYMYVCMYDVVPAAGYRNSVSACRVQRYRSTRPGYRVPYTYLYRTWYM
jgi:hypothetical protein